LCYNYSMISGGFTDIRPSPIAGTWYSANPVKLQSSIMQYLSEARLPDIQGEIVALIVPHAGHVYSGLTAAHAFKAIEGMSFERVVVISPLHQYYPQPILTSGHQAYETPLGLIPVDLAGVEAVNAGLMASMDVQLTPLRHDQEHSLEIELPFLQCVLSEPFSLIPIMLRDQSARLAKSLGHILAGLLRQGKTLLVASTDLSHFYTRSTANRLDKTILAAMEAFDPQQLYRLAASGEGQACGLAAVAAVLWAAQDHGTDAEGMHSKVTVVDYRTSADVTHDSSSVVGYGAAVITRTN